MNEAAPSRNLGGVNQSCLRKNYDKWYSTNRFRNLEIIYKPCSSRLFNVDIQSFSTISHHLLEEFDSTEVAIFLAILLTFPPVL